MSNSPSGFFHTNIFKWNGWKSKITIRKGRYLSIIWKKKYGIFLLWNGPSPTGKYWKIICDPQIVVNMFFLFFLDWHHPFVNFFHFFFWQTITGIMIQREISRRRKRSLTLESSQSMPMSPTTLEQILCNSFIKLFN